VRLVRGLRREEVVLVVGGGVEADGGGYGVCRFVGESGLRDVRCGVVSDSELCKCSGLSAEQGGVEHSSFTKSPPSSASLYGPEASAHASSDPASQDGSRMPFSCARGCGGFTSASCGGGCCGGCCCPPSIFRDGLGGGSTSAGDSVEYVEICSARGESDAKLLSARKDER
jgi:hypothetical protein